MRRARPVAFTAGPLIDLAGRLEALGFNLFFAADDTATRERWLKHAVREFQIYASMPFVARQKAGVPPARWLDRLERVANSAIYAGPKDGDPVAPGLAAAISHWETNSYRCPVVVEIYVKTTALKPVPPGPNGIEGNYWRYDDPRLTTFFASRPALKQLRVRVCDLSGHFCPPHGTAENQMADGGRVSQVPPYWRGGYSFGDRDADEILPETLVGTPWNQIASAATKATFRVIRAVSELEANAHFDGFNTYDDAVASLGPYNWALAPAYLLLKTAPTPQHQAGAGELACYLAFWEGRDGAIATAKLKDPFGLVFKPAWPAASAGPRLPSWPSTRNYVGTIDWAPFESANDGKRKLGDLEWLRTAHWAWRWLALSRFVPSFRTRQWDLARTRVRDILEYAIDPSDRPGKPAGTKTVPLSRMFTSETAVALLLRCHVRKAGFLHNKGFAHPSLRLALAFANLPANVATWGDKEQAILVEALVAVASFSGLLPAERKKLQGQLHKLYDHRTRLAKLPLPAKGLFADCGRLAQWPDKKRFRWFKGPKATGGYVLEEAACDPIKKTHDSFTLDANGLPPMP